MEEEKLIEASFICLCLEAAVCCSGADIIKLVLVWYKLFNNILKRRVISRGNGHSSNMMLHFLKYYLEAFGRRRTTVMSEVPFSVLAVIA